jgi:hypothetical protein
MLYRFSVNMIGPRWIVALALIREFLAPPQVGCPTTTRHGAILTRLRPAKRLMAHDTLVVDDQDSAGELALDD